MGRLRACAVAATLIVLTPPAAALAADYTPPPVPIGKSWYLRGHIGLAAQHLGSLDNALYDTTDIVEFLDPGHFDAAPIFGIGFGVYSGDHFRFDIVGEYRGKASFYGLDRYETTDDGDPATFDGTNEYTGKKSEFLVLANAYFDMGTWRGITPYVGAGIGMSRNTIWDFTDVNVPNAGLAYGATDSKWNLAWALHAGASLRATNNMSIDIGYSFVNLGDAQSGDLIAFDGTNTIDNPMIFNDLISHDLKIGVRWDLDGSPY